VIPDRPEFPPNLIYASSDTLRGDRLGLSQARSRRACYDRASQRMLENMQVRNLSPLTQRAHLEASVEHRAARRPVAAQLGPEEIRAYQVHFGYRETVGPGLDRDCAPWPVPRFLYTVTLQKQWSVP
jgi:hypothetical protein